ncbi:hypothetical protein SAMN04487830_11777 [Pseudobutyrivibrio sp. OR37]|uniref:hypothetical protein n=1 Tax=Pseudobutyrivibrio sp. OR37 TaxID=1798186 RepID=UPI0008E9BE0E|nr:hypothetical protein [Pseudobutyrivibrio sp. OR37]SFI01290.1 hypothetical protein SAMN04487830_11777 [Pseudobutyrivibrio sp. OR37]
MFNIIMLVVFSLVTMFYAFYIVSHIRSAVDSANVSDRRALAKSFFAIGISVVTLAILWFQAAFVYFYR